MGQHLSDGLRDPATMAFNLGAHGAYRFVELPFWKILRTYGVSINQPRDLDI